MVEQTQGREDVPGGAIQTAKQPLATWTARVGPGVEGRHGDIGGLPAP